jgi:hypothetical protein
MMARGTRVRVSKPTKRIFLFGLMRFLDLNVVDDPARVDSVPEMLICWINWFILLPQVIRRHAALFVRVLVVWIQRQWKVRVIVITLKIRQALAMDFANKLNLHVMLYCVDFRVVDARFGTQLVARGFGVDSDWLLAKSLLPFCLLWSVPVPGLLLNVNNSMILGFDPLFGRSLVLICEDWPR